MVGLTRLQQSHGMHMNAWVIWAKGRAWVPTKWTHLEKCCIQYTNNHQTLPHDQANTYESLGVTELRNVPDI